jgi:hypothetical protein
MRRVVAGGWIVLLAACAPSAAAASIVHATHTVSVKGELVDHWTIDEPGPCGLVGDGTLTVKFESVQPARVWPFIDQFASSETGHFGTWIIGVPLPPHAVKDLPAVKASGTVTRVDNTVTRPGSDGEACDPPEKEGCGEVRLRAGGRSAKLDVGRYDKTRIAVDLGADGFAYPRKPCGSGNLSSFSDFRFTGGDRKSGVLRLDMPRERRLKRRRVVRVTDSDHKRTSHDDVTRTATVTFKKL